ncbi:MAG: radical SAM protein [bacterium]|nr:radical SAM protein [bacterium]
MANVLLVCFDSLAYAPGLRLLSSLGNAAGHNTYLLFLIKESTTFQERRLETSRELAAFVSLLDELSIDVVGLSVMTPEYHRAVRVAECARAEGRHVVWGGIHAAIRPEECLPYADAVCLTEAEATWTAYLDALERSGDRRLPNFVLPGEDAAEVRAGGRLELISDLDSLPFPDYDVARSYYSDGNGVLRMDWESYRKYNTWEGTYYRLLTSRGCPYQCTYCVNSFFWRQFGKQWLRRRSVENSIAEIAWIRQKMPFIRGINIQDDSFFMGSDEWLEDFCRRYKAEVGLPFIARMIPRFTTEKRIELLADAGFDYAGIGLQTGSERLSLEVYERVQDNAKFLENDWILSKYGVAKSYDILVDNPFETERDTLETIDILLRLKKPFYVVTYSLTPFPETRFYDKAKSAGFLDRMPDPYNSAMYATDPDNYYTPKTLRRLIETAPYIPKALLRYCRGHWKGSLVGWFAPQLTRFYQWIIRVINWGRYKHPWFLRLVLFLGRIWGRTGLRREIPREEIHPES